MKKLQFARSGYIGISCIFYAAAVIYLFFPGLPPMALSCFSGVILILYGIIKFMAFGLLLMVAGVLLLVKNVSVAQYLTPGLGWMALLDSLFHIQMAKEARDFGIEEWKLVLGLSIATGVLSVLLIMHGFPGPQATRILTCIVLLACGVINHCIVMLMVHFPRRSTAKEPDTGKESV